MLLIKFFLFFILFKKSFHHKHKNENTPINKTKAETYNVNFWDFSGNEIEDETIKKIINHKVQINCFFLMSSTSDHNSLTDIDKWDEYIKSLEDPICLLPRVIIINNKENEPRKVDIQEIKKIVIHLDIPYYILSTNNKLSVTSFLIEIKEKLKLNMVFDYKSNVKSDFQSFIDDNQKSLLNDDLSQLDDNFCKKHHGINPNTYNTNTQKEYENTIKSTYLESDNNSNNNLNYKIKTDNYYKENFYNTKDKLKQEDELVNKYNQGQKEYSNLKYNLNNHNNNHNHNNKNNNDSKSNLRGKNSVNKDKKNLLEIKTRNQSDIGSEKGSCCHKCIIF